MPSLEAQEPAGLTEIPINRAVGLDQEVEQIYEDTKSSISAYLVYLGVPGPQVQEVTQEVYLRFYQSQA